MLIARTILFGALGASLLSAVTVLAGTAGWSGYGKVIELEPTTQGRFLVRLDLPSNPSGCRDKDWYYRDYTGAGAEYMFQAVLAALRDARPLQVYVTGNCDINGYAEISSLRIAP